MLKPSKLANQSAAAGKFAEYLDPAMPYPATWDMVEDEELCFLDWRLVQAMDGRAASIALDRLSAMMTTRRFRRQAVHDEVMQECIGAGLDPLALLSRENVMLPAGRSGLSGDRRREAWPMIRDLFAKISAPFGKERRVRSLRGELLVHAIAIKVLDLLQSQMELRRTAVLGSAEVTTQPLYRSTLLDLPAIAALGSVFSGFNIAYLLPQHAFQAELLSAAAWLGWKTEGCHAPLPSAAARYLEEFGDDGGFWTSARHDAFDPHVILRLALELSGISVANLQKHAHDEWPSASSSVDLRPKGPINEPLCVALLDLLDIGKRHSGA